MAGKLTTHVLDTTRGVGAAGLRVILQRPDGSLVAVGVLDLHGRATLLNDIPGAGLYEIVFDAAAYHRRIGVTLSDPPFLGLVTVGFGVADPGIHYHVPLLLSPYGYSTYRGT